METFAELPVITRGEVNRRALAEIELPAQPRWADMTGSKPTGWGLDERINVGEDYETCQRWGEALFAVGFSGIYYRPRHFMGRQWQASVALFGNPGHQPTSFGCSTPVRYHRDWCTKRRRCLASRSGRPLRWMGTPIGSRRLTVAQGDVAPVHPPVPVQRPDS